MNRALTTALLVASLTLSPRLLAQAPSGGTVGVARAAGERGLQLFSQGKWGEAYESFQAADEAYHAPTLVLYMAHCQRMLGKWATARSLYQRVLDEPLGRGAPDQFAAAQATAREEIVRLNKKVATLDLTLSGEAVSRARLTVDGAPSPAAAKAVLSLDPGKHTLEVQVEGAPPIQREVTVEEGGTAALEIALPPPPPTPAPLAPTPPPASSEPGSRVPAYLAFGAAGLTATIGVITGAVSLSQAAAAKEGCRPDGHCPAANLPQAEAAGRTADASTAMFALAGIAAATGVVLLVIRPSFGARNDVSTALRVSVGPRGALVTGAF
jgi:hypothetical protein